MSEVEVPFGDSPGDTAVLLLAAAEELGLDVKVAVRTTSKGMFLVPEEVNEAAFGEKKPAKKTTAKKAAAKKTEE